MQIMVKDHFTSNIRMGIQHDPCDRGTWDGRVVDGRVVDERGQSQMAKIILILSKNIVT